MVTDEAVIVFKKKEKSYQSELCQDWMLPHGMIEDVLQQGVVFPPAVTFGDAHPGGFSFPWGQQQTIKTLQGSEEQDEIMGTVSHPPCF